MTADISTDLSSWSTTAASNQPDYADSVGPNNLADNLRAIQAAVRLMQSSSTIASATTTDLSTVSSYILAVSGTTTITGLGTMPAGIVKTLIFAGALTFTHNATTLILPTGANITTAADDVAIMLSLGSGNWRCVSYMRKSGAPLTSVATFGDGTVGAPSIAFTSDTDSGIYRIGANNIGVGVNGAKVVDIATTGAAVTGTLSASTSITAGTVVDSSVSGYRMASGVHGFSYRSATVGAGTYTGLVLTKDSVDVALLTGDTLFTNNATFGSASAYAQVVNNRILLLGTSNSYLQIDNTRSTDGSDPLLYGRYTNWAGNATYDAVFFENSGGKFFRINTVGAVFADGAYSGSGADFAEYFLPVQGANLQPGDTVALSGEMVKLAGPHDDVIGVVSETPTVAGDMGLKDEGGVLIGLIGKLWIKRGSPLNPSWRLLRAGVTHDRYLVR